MSPKNKSIYLTSIMAAVTIGGFAFYLLQYEALMSWKMITIIVLALLILSFPIYGSYRKAKDMKKNIPLEDEMSRLVEIHAGAYAFRYSMISWFLIYLFHARFPDPEELLGAGIMAAAAIYGLTWLYFKRYGIPHDQQN